MGGFLWIGHPLVLSDIKRRMVEILSARPPFETPPAPQDERDSDLLKDN